MEREREREIELAGRRVEDKEGHHDLHMHTVCGTVSKEQAWKDGLFMREC